MTKQQLIERYRWVQREGITLAGLSRVGDAAISPARANCIKLGKGGAWERECLEVGTIRLGYEAWRHDLCASGRWDELVDWVIATGMRTTPGTARDAVRQIRAFYEADEACLWVTFSRGAMWWGFMEPGGAEELDDGSKSRRVAGGWKSHDLAGVPLTISSLSGRLTRLAAYRGTVCSVDVASGLLDYLVRRINGQRSEAGERVDEGLGRLEEVVAAAIKALTWRDFEVLVDLIVRESGWRRMDMLGGGQKGVDLVLREPMTGEEMVITVKSEISADELLRHLAELSDSHPNAEHRVVAVHTPPAGIQLTEGWQLWNSTRLSALVVDLGLSRWVMDRSL